jgi:hypothetical protein
VPIKDSEQIEIRIIIEVHNCDGGVFHEFTPALNNKKVNLSLLQFQSKAPFLICLE